MEPLGLGMIGLHHQHPRWYFPLWANLPEYRPLAISEADESFLVSERAFFKLDAVADYRRILDRKDIDVVAIWLPHSRMPQAVADAAAAGKHVIVEKPCAADVVGAAKIAEVARRFPRIRISAPYCWRTHPVSAEIVSAVRKGLLGEITAVEGRLNAGGAHRYIRDHAEWMLKSAEGGGPMWNLGVHWIDYFRWLTGKEVLSVSGATTGPVGSPPRDIEDAAQAVLKFHGGAIGILDISYALQDSYPDKRDIYVAIRGTLGAIAWKPNWEGTSNELLLVSEHPSVGSQKSRVLPIACKQVPGYCGQMCWEWLRDFAAAVREERPPLVSTDDMLAAVKVADAFYRSVKSGRAETPNR
ncbi:MAG: Gfo/Idh/MocA family protein [Phycisphaerae bacterium]